MFESKRQKSIVGLDIEAGSVAATEVRSNGRVEVVRHGVIGLEPGAFREGEVTDPELLGESLKELVHENKLSRDVRVGIANQRVAVRVLRLPDLDGGELEAAIRFQAQDHIPMPLDQAVLDWQVVERGQGEGGQQLVSVVAVAARRDMIGNLMAALSHAGLRPVGIDHSAFGMIRALARSERAAVGAAEYVAAPAAGELPVGAEGSPAAPDAMAAGARLYCNLGDVTNLAVAHAGACLFTRISPFGIEAIAQRLAERQELTLDHARRWLVHVGLDADLAAIDGEAEVIAAARETLIEGAAKLADELRMSIDFYAAQEGAIPVDGIIACGPGTAIPGLVDHLQQGIGRPFEVARPTPLGHLDEASAARLTLSFGLALEG
ncbi:MAG TPA: type IV pilus assembly protein PilM [Solirubrobacterales bacterium]|nr:type IV pilus assembly protein PilM [Solirubrobacterales bacterium]